MKRLILILAFISACSLPALSQETTLDTDLFGQGCVSSCPTNAENLHTYRSIWVTPAASCCNAVTIEGCTAGCGVGSSANAILEVDAIEVGPSWGNSQFVHATFDSTNFNNVLAVVCLRHDTSGAGTAGSAYCAGVDNGDFNPFYNISYMTGNVLTRLTFGTCETTQTAHAGDAMDFFVTGSSPTTLTLKVNGSQIATCTDTGNNGPQSGGAPGFKLITTATGGLAYMNTWSAGTVGAASNPNSGFLPQQVVGFFKRPLRALAAISLTPRHAF